ncbi:hypothetical protein ABW20_dc0101862 [Dactylellina cionopaga]|nr:hypothetical protein ABW20_dc0101862 [Dactylellina cionopaga]
MKFTSQLIVSILAVSVSAALPSTYTSASAGLARRDGMGPMPMGAPPATGEEMKKMILDGQDAMIAELTKEIPMMQKHTDFLKTVPTTVWDKLVELEKKIEASNGTDATSLAESMATWNQLSADQLPK